jgi:hypothetical protein
MPPGFCLTNPGSAANFLLNISTKGTSMATVNFSVPDDIKTRFNKTFRGRNKSAVLSNLMKEAVEQEENRKRRIKAVDELLTLRSGATARPVTDAAVRKARQRGRP